MEPLLTLVIAIGGIATGIGGIWTAVVTRHLARVTERSVAEQSQSLREQNERARVSLAVDLLYKLDERWDSQRYLNYRKRALRYVKENYFVDDSILEVQHLDTAAEIIFDLFDELGYLTKIGVLPLERVWASYGDGPALAWVLWEPAIKELREEDNPRQYENFEYLYHQLSDFNRQSTGRSEPPTKEELRQFIEDNISYVEDAENSPTDEEEAKKG